jgi:hypothetical protein
MTALQPHTFLTGIHRLLVTNKGRSALLSANHCQGQLKTPQSVTVASPVITQKTTIVKEPRSVVVVVEILITLAVTTFISIPYHLPISMSINHAL